MDQKMKNNGVIIRVMLLVNICLKMITLNVPFCRNEKINF